MDPKPPPYDIAARIGSRALWYHTIEVAPGAVTPGWFDLRPIVERLPWPDVTGKRCLDVGTYDGFLAFELERRGAAEVVAVDIDDHDDWDWPLDVRARGGEELARLAGPEKGGGFRLAHELLGSRVERRAMSVYDLDPEVIGRFDVVVCGSLLLHLRDPLRALAAIASVCEGLFLSNESIDLVQSVINRRTPVLRLDGIGALCQWHTPNVAGHRRMLQTAGFELLQTARVAIPFGPAHPAVGRGPRDRARSALVRSLCGNDGVPHHAALGRVSHRVPPAPPR